MWEFFVNINIDINVLFKKLLRNHLLNIRWINFWKIWRKFVSIFSSFLQFVIFFKIQKCDLSMQSDALNSWKSSVLNFSKKIDTVFIFVLSFSFSTNSWHQLWTAEMKKKNSTQNWMKRFCTRRKIWFVCSQFQKTHY